MRAPGGVLLKMLKLFEVICETFLKSPAGKKCRISFF